MTRTPVYGRIHDYLEHWAAAAPDREALAMDNVRFAYRQLADRVARESQALWRLGLRPGGTVAVICPARPEFFATFLAIVSVGGVFQGLSPKSALPELIYQVGDASPTLIVWHGDDHNGALAEQVAKEVGHDPKAVSGHDLAVAHESATTGVAVATAAKQVTPEHPAAIVYTSGTTGRPKGALLPHIGFTSCGVVQANRWVGERTPRMPCVEPINHVAAVADACVAMLVAGGTVVFQEQFHAEQLLELLTAEHINLWYTDPAVLSLCSRSSAWERTDFSGLDRICWSGGRAPLPLVRELGERVPLRSTSWGMTETVGSLTYTDDDASDAVLSATIGRLDRAYEGRVLRDDGAPAEAGETGELQVRGPHIMRGYWRRPDATAEAFTADGWFRTGDLVMPWDDGNLELVGRRSEMFKSGGENIYPREVENALESHPAVSVAVVVSRPDDLWGEVGHAYIVARGEVVEADLREHVRTQLARFKVPKAFTFVSEFPLLGSGKIDRRALHDKAREGAD